jgi:undecaprenyl-diphosphatase
MAGSSTKSLGTTLRSLPGTMLAVARREVVMLSLLSTIAGGIWAFIVIASEMAEGETGAIDKKLLLALRDPADITKPLGPEWFQQTMLQFTALGSTAVLSLITIGVIGWLLLWRKYRTALLATLAIGGGAVLSSALKTSFARLRPDLVPHGDLVNELSFPSGHAFSSAVVYLTLAALLARVQPNRRLKIYLVGVAIVLTMLIGMSRIYLGVHWPSDVLAGWCVGSAWALMCWTIALWWNRRAAASSAPRSGRGQ